MVFSSQRLFSLHWSEGVGADAPPEAALVVICLSGFREEAYAPPSLGSGAPRFLPGCALFQVLAGVQSTLPDPPIVFCLDT